MTDEQLQQLPLPELTVTTTPSQRITDDHASAVGLPEASQRTGISVSTLRRRIKLGGIAGAYRAPSASGEQWLIPVVTLDILTKGKPSGLSATSVTASELENLRNQVMTLGSELELQRTLADERNKTIEALHLTMRALGAGAQRRWWQRK